MKPIAIRRFDKQVISISYQCRIFSYRSFSLPYITGENNFGFFSSFSDKYFDRGRAKDMSGILESDRNIVVDFYQFGIFYRLEKRHAFLRFV